MSPSALTQVRARQAMALRQLGDYSKAIQLFADVLGSQKKSYLNIQIEAAKTFQQWGISGGNSKAFTKAINGDKPARDGRNAIWGWGRIAKLVAKNEQYRDTFHEARYNIALCRYRLGLSQSGKEKTQTLKRAKSDITITKQLYRLGKKSQARRYEDLLKKIQRALNENPVGFGNTEST
jgi:tetratricopeptide (TPR) repeat protein